MRLVDRVRVTPCEKSGIPARTSAETGFYAGWKGRQKVAFQSSLERSFVQLCDFANEIQAIRWEPFSIIFDDLVDLKERRYTPDYLVDVAMEDGSRRTLIIEVKPESEIDRIWQHDPQGVDARRHIAMMAWCQSQPATRFVLVSEKLLEAKGLPNIVAILDRGSFHLETDLQAALFRMFEQSDEVRLLDMIELGELFGFSRGNLISSVLRLCADDEVSFDVTAELSDTTSFWRGSRTRVFNP